jgi:hypothetical protein
LNHPLIKVPFDSRFALSLKTKYDCNKAGFGQLLE